MSHRLPDPLSVMALAIVALPDLSCKICQKCAIYPSDPLRVVNLCQILESFVITKLQTNYRNVNSNCKTQVFIAGYNFGALNHRIRNIKPFIS